MIVFIISKSSTLSNFDLVYKSNSDRVSDLDVTDIIVKMCYGNSMWYFYVVVHHAVDNRY